MAASAMAIGGRVFKPGYTMRLALGALMLGSAVVLALVALDDSPPNQAMLVAAGALVVGFVIACMLIARTSITVGDMGIRKESILGTAEMMWPQVSETRYVFTPINYSAHFGLIGALFSSLGKKANGHATFRVIGLDGKQIKITSNFADANEAIAMVLERTMPELVKKLRARIERGETVAFGPVSLNKTAIRWKEKEPIPLAQLKSAELAGANLAIKREGKWLSAISVKSDKVPNVLALLEVLEGLAPQLKAKGFDPLARVRA